MIVLVLVKLIFIIEGVVCGLFVYEVIYHTSPGNFPNTDQSEDIYGVLV